MKLTDIFETQDVEFQELRRGIVQSMQRAMRRVGLPPITNFPEWDMPLEGPWKEYKILKFHKIPLNFKRNDPKGRSPSDQMDMLWKEVYNQLKNTFPNTDFKVVTSGRGTNKSLWVALTPQEEWDRDRAYFSWAINKMATDKKPKNPPPQLRLVK